MNYKITEHYARSEEKLIAEFNELNDAKLFMTKKSSIDEEERKQVIYRLYDDYDLLHEVNTENISTTHANYAEGDGEFNHACPFLFQVMMSRMNALERKTIAQFNDKKDADLFVVYKLELNKTVHSDDLFFIVKGNTLMDAFNKAIIEHQKKESSGATDDEKKSSDHLSPLSTRPTPGGGPPDYWVEREDGDEEI